MRFLQFLSLSLLSLSALSCAPFANCEFYESFNDETWLTRWAQSTSESSSGQQREQFTVGLGKWYGDEKEDQGLKTTVDYRLWGASARLPASIPLSGSARQKLVVSYAMKHEQLIECGGGFLKLFPSSVDQLKIDGQTDFVIQFGPDVCGTSTREISFIISAGSNRYKLFREIRFIDDHVLHHYTLVLNTDNTYAVYIDNSIARFLDGREARGNLLTDLIPASASRDSADLSIGVSASALSSVLDVSVVGFEMWQVRAGSVFDSVYVGGDEEKAREVVERQRKHAETEAINFQSAENERQQAEERIRQQISDLREKQERELEEQQAALSGAARKKDKSELKFDL